MFDPTGTRIATSRRVEGIADVWDAQTGDRVATLAAAAAIGDIAFSPDGTSRGHRPRRRHGAAVGPRDGSPAARARAATAAGVGHVVFSPDGSKLASVGDDGIARVWALDLDDLIAIATIASRGRSATTSAASTCTSSAARHPEPAGARRERRLPRICHGPAPPSRHRPPARSPWQMG